MDKRTTEQSSLYNHLERMSSRELLLAINSEDRTVPEAVSRAIPIIEDLVDGIVERVHRGGRVFYLGAGTSGRLGVVDASEIPPTYGVHNLFIGLMAGGDRAFRDAVEGAEDSTTGGWEDMLSRQPGATAFSPPASPATRALPPLPPHRSLSWSWSARSSSPAAPG